MGMYSRSECFMCDEGNRSECKHCEGSGYDLRYQPIPVCPHCGKEQSTDDLYDSTDLQCEECDGWMELVISYTPDYSTTKGEDPCVRMQREQEAYERRQAERAPKEGA